VASWRSWKSGRHSHGVFGNARGVDQDARRRSDDRADASGGPASPRSSPIGSVVLLLRAVAFTVLLPGTVVVLVPMLLFDQGGRFDIGCLRLGGLLPILAGGPTLLWCIWDFAHRGRGTLAPIDPPQFIVRSGPYRWVRNPMYVADLLILIGEGVLFESLPILAWAGAMALAFHLFVVLYEEPSLANRFGAAYKEYRRTVPRWRPRRP
jgi:protein-S-isoprenylcysteine O-methyltransferase Ste14